MAATPTSAPTALDQLDARAWACVDFLSDVHLHSAEAATAAAWMNYLRHSPAQALFILGDLFEAWVGDDVLQHPWVLSSKAAPRPWPNVRGSDRCFFCVATVIF